MFDLFGKIWLKGVKRLIKTQSTQAARQRKAAITTATKTAKALAKSATKTAAKNATKSVLRSIAPSIEKAKTRKPGGVKRSRAKAAGARTSAASRMRGSTSSTPLDAGGTWRQVYQSSTAVVGTTRSRRLGGWLFLPTESVPAEAGSLPLLVMLHGCDQTAPDFATGTRMNRLAARHGFAVLYPQQSASAHAQRCWPWYRRSLQEGGDELALIAAMIERICAQNRLDTRRVYIAGLSAGAALAHNLALRRPDLIAAVALHSSPVFGVADSRMSAFSVMQQGTRDPLQPIKQLQREQGGPRAMPSLIIQGEQDPVVRAVNAGQLFRQCCAVNTLDPAAATAPHVRARRAGCDGYRVTDVKRGSRTMVRLVEVDHLSHAWSGGDPALRYNAAPGPDASAMLWAFLRRHSRT